MLAISTQNQQGIFEKVLRGKDGRLYAVRFVITDTDGQIRGRVLSVEPVLELGYRGKGIGYRVKRLCLASIYTEPKPEPKQPYTNPLGSPYFSSLDFFVSQMTRA